MQSDLKAEIKTLHSQALKMKKELKQNTAELDRLQETYSSEELKFTKKLNLEKQKQLRQEEEAATKDLKEELARVQANLISLDENHKVALEQLNPEQVRKNFEDDEGIYEEIKESMQQTNNQMSKLVGNRLKNVILHNLDTQHTELQQEDLEDFINYFNKINTKLDKMNNSLLMRASRFLESKLGYLQSKRIAENDLNKVLVAVLAIIAGYFFVYYVLPFYLLTICFVAGYKCVQAYRLYEAILVFKAVQDNLDAIEQRLLEQVQEQIAKEVEIENERYDNQRGKLKTNEANLMVAIDKALADTAKAFNFKGEDIQNDFKRCQQTQSDSIARLVEKNKNLQEQINSIQMEITKKNKQLSEEVKQLPQKLLNPDSIGEDKIFSSKFLIDIIDEKPVFFEHPKTASLFLYEDLGDVNDFVRLLVFQLRATMNPFNFDITVIDKLYMGASLQGFVSEKEKYKTLFNIVTDEASYAEYLDTTKLVITKRMRAIKSMTSNIDIYNENMLKTRSVPESYKFLFWYNPTPSDFENLTIAQLLRVGGDLGIYLHGFYSKREFIKGGSDSEKLIHNVPSVYLIEKGKLVPRSKEFVMDLIEKA